MRFRSVTAFLMAVAATSAGQAQLATIAVAPFSNPAGISENVTNVLATMMTTAVQQSGKFTIVNRENLNVLFDEQGLGASGAVDPSTMAKLGEVRGVDYFLFGTVTEYTNNNKSNKVLNAIDFKKKKVRMAIDVQFVDSENSDVVFAESFSAEKNASDVAVGDIAGSEGSDPDVPALARDVVDAIVQRCLVSVFPPKVVQVKEAKVHINGGTSMFQVDDVFEMVIEGDPIPDGEGGFLGTEKMSIGTLRITAVEEKYSTAEVMEGEAREGAQVRFMPEGAAKPKRKGFRKKK